MKEHLLDDLRKKKFLFLRTDPNAFIKEYCKVFSPNRGLIPFIPTGYQHQLMQTYIKNHTIVNHARCSGITTITAMYILWYCVFNNDKTVGIVSNKQVMSQMNLDIIRLAYDNFPDWLKQILPITTNIKSAISFANGTKILGFSSNACSLRGTSFSLMHMDNFGILSENKQDEILGTILPHMLFDKNSRIIITSAGGSTTSPFRKMFDLAKSDINGFKAVEVKPDT